jgi:hypothetical protein
MRSAIWGIGAFMADLAHDDEDHYWALLEALLEEHAGLLDLESESLRSRSA